MRCLSQKCFPNYTSASDAEQISHLSATQSPIAISVKRCPLTSLDLLQFNGYWNKSSKCTLLNNGQTALFTFDYARPTIKGGPLVEEYIFEQMHFHWSIDDYTGCEHILDGKGYAAECHIVHYNSKYGSFENAVNFHDGLAVVGFFMESVDEANIKMNEFIKALDNIKRTNTSVKVSTDTLSWIEMDRLSGPYVTYKGSLTTPPFNECVTWIVYEKPLLIGTEQLKSFKELEGKYKQQTNRTERSSHAAAPTWPFSDLHSPKQIQIVNKTYFPLK